MVLAHFGDFKMDKFLESIRAELNGRIALIGAFDDIKVLRHETIEQWVAILRNCNGPLGSWRIQRFDRDGFIGHQCYASKELAVANAARERFTQHDDGALDRLERTAAFRLGNAISDERDRLNASQLSFTAFLARVTELKQEFHAY